MVDYKVVDDIAVLQVNNPPVNALSFSVRKGLQDGLQKALADNSVKAIVIVGKGRTFPAGADIREFRGPPQPPWLTEVGQALEDSRKPVVAAIHGTCLGGGLEVALFSHYRVALSSASVGFPEVLIGILPGAAGTQRLPRVTSVPVALDMITSGRHVPAPEALKHGILDLVVKGDIETEGIKFAKSVIGKPLHDHRLKNVPVKEGKDTIQGTCEAFLAKFRKKQPGFMAPIACVRAVRAAGELPYEEGLKVEKKLMNELITSFQARALQYIFFAERSAPKWKLPTGESYLNCKPLPVKTCGVIGAGTMGTGIVICLVNAGIPVTLVEQNNQFLQQGVKMIHSLLEGSVKLRRLTPEQMQRSKSLIHASTSLQDLKNVDLVIEAVYEDLNLKMNIFGMLDAICKPETILCSNTSTLDIDKIALSVSREDRVAGMHFFVPAYHMRLLENIYGTKTSGQTCATIMELGKKIRKVPVLVKTCHGFVANRTMNRWSAEALFCVEDGALPHHVDAVVEDFGMPMGPFKVRDLSGLDVGWRIAQEQAKAKAITLDYGTRFIQGERYCSITHRLHDLGRHGRKTGVGFYRYDKPGGKVPIVDEHVASILEDHRQALGIIRRQIVPQEIMERCLYAAINECFKCLEDGNAAKPEDIDVIWVYGFGWPKFKGGPMFYASQIGLKKCLERILYYHAICFTSSHWVPSELLKRLASLPEDPPMSEWTMSAPSHL